MEIPWKSLQPTTLRALIEEFVTRDGTDYGSNEASLERKVADVRRQLEKGEVKLCFDPESETCNLTDEAGR